MKVLRVEHPVSGQGPYTHGGLNGPALQYMSQCYSKISNPDPDDDGLRGVAGYSFGFKSLDQLHDWFSVRVLRALMHRVGFAVVEYEIEERYVLFGGKQIAFDKQYATKVGEVEFTK